MKPEYVEGGLNMQDTNDVAIERRMAVQRRHESKVRTERARIASVIAAGNEDESDAPVEWAD